MNVEVIEAPPSTPSVISLPPALEKWAASQGKQLTLVWNNPKAIGSYRAYGYSVLMVSAIPEDIRDEVLSEMENPQEHYNKVVKADSVVMVRSLEAQERWRAVNEERINDRESAEFNAVDEVAERARAKSRQLSGSPQNLVDIVPEKVYPVASHVAGGKALRDSIAETLDAAAKTPR